MENDWWGNFWANVAGTVMGGIVLAVLSALTVLWLRRISLMRPPEFERLLRKMKRGGRLGTAAGAICVGILTLIRFLTDGSLEDPISVSSRPLDVAIVLCAVVELLGFLSVVGAMTVAKALRWLAEELHGRWVNETLPHDRGGPKDNWRRVKDL